MEGVTNTEVAVCDENLDENNDGIGPNDENIREISQELSSSFLTASDLFLKRGANCKNKSKDEDLEVRKGDKLYYPDECLVAEERIEDIMLDTKRNLELQRIAKNRDCMKAEWNEEFKVAIVPYLKGKTTQHMGITIKGRCALSPEEALFLLEKGSIEVEHNEMSLSIEEAYTLMLRGKLATEKYEVYSFLSQQGFIVINHRPRINQNLQKFMNSLNTKAVKRKAADDSGELPEQKRLTFTGVLSSNSETNSVNTQGNAVSDSVLSNGDSSKKQKSTTEDMLKDNESNMLQDTNSKINSEDATISPDSTYQNELADSTEKEASASHYEVQDKDNIRMTDDHLVSSKDIENSTSNKSKSANIQENMNVNNDEIVVDTLTDNNKDGRHFKNIHDDKMNVEQDHDDNEIDVEVTANDKVIDVGSTHDKVIDVDSTHDKVIDVDSNHDKVIDIDSTHDKVIDVDSTHELEIDVESTHNDQEIDVENTHNDQEIDVESTHIDQEIDVVNANEGDSNEIIIEDVQKSRMSSDVNENSLNNDNEDYLSSDGIDILCDESTERSIDVYGYSDDCESVSSSKAKDSQKKSSKEHDDDITLVEVKKKEKKPLAVIDLLSDDDASNESQNEEGDNSEEEEDGANGEEVYEDSDDEIQVLDVFPVSSSNLQSTSKPTNSIKLESKKCKIPIDVSNVKSSYVRKMAFPDAFRKDIICIPHPPNNVLPLHVQPAKEAYVLTLKKPQPKQARLWNSYKDLQDYQRDRRIDRSMNFNARSNNPFRDQNDSFGNRGSPFNTPENSRDFGFSRNNQNNSIQHNRNLFQPPNMNHNERPSLLPRPDAYNQQMPFNMNFNMQNLSSSNPVAFVNEIQKTVYSVASSMISSMLGQHLNPNAPSPTHSPAFGESSMMGVSSHSNNFNLPGMPGPMGYNSGRSDFNPIRFPPEPSFSGERYPFSAYTPENNWRQQDNIPLRNFTPKESLFPCKYRSVRRKRNWNEVKEVVEELKESDSGSDIEEVPINLNQFLWGNDIQPLVKPGSRLPTADVLKALRITQMANLCDTNRCNDRYLPAKPCLEISFDVYLPSSKRSERRTPKCRIIVVKSSDPIPRYSELVYWQRKFNDGASLQVAIVDHGDISFYSFNSLNVPDIIPFES